MSCNQQLLFHIQKWCCESVGQRLVSLVRQNSWKQCRTWQIGLKDVKSLIFFGGDSTIFCLVKHPIVACLTSFICTFHPTKTQQKRIFPHKTLNELPLDALRVVNAMSEVWVGLVGGVDDPYQVGKSSSQHMEQREQNLCIFQFYGLGDDKFLIVAEK